MANNETLLIVSHSPEFDSSVVQSVLMVSHTWAQPDPWPVVGSQSSADAVADLPNSGEVSPFQSNVDALRGIK